MKLTPKGNMVVIARDQNFALEKTQSGLFLAPSSLNPEHKHFVLRKGVVLGVGPGKFSPKGEFIKTTVKEGEVVIYASTQATEIYDSNEHCYFDLVPEHEIPASIG